MVSIIYVATPSPFLSSFFCSLISNMVSELQVERSCGWWEKILRVLQASETLKEYKPWRILRVLQTSETQKGVQVMQIGLWDSEKSTSRREYLLVSQCCVKHFFELKKSFFFALFGVWAFICSIFCWSEHNSFWW